MILSSCVIGMMHQISEEFGEYIKAELKKREIPIQAKHTGLFMILFAHNNNVEFKDIADVWRKSKSTLCDIVSRYCDQGLLERVSCDLDKRHVYIKLTEEGMKYAKEFDEIAVEFLERATSGLSEDQKVALREILLNMKKNLKHPLCCDKEMPIK